MTKLKGWISGIYLTSYKTDKPDGTLVGFDSDLGEVYAYKGNVVTRDDLPAEIDIIRDPEITKKEEGSDAFWSQLDHD